MKRIFWSILFLLIFPPIYMLCMGLCDWLFEWPHWALACRGEKTDWKWALGGWIIILIINRLFNPVAKEHWEFCKNDTYYLMGY